MARAANFNAVFEAALPAISWLHRPINTRKRATIFSCFNKKPDQIQEHPLKTTRRLSLSLGIATISFFANSSVPDSLAEDNGYWITTPTIPMTPINNKIYNKETGTRSFIQKGLYIADTGPNNRAVRIYKYAFDLQAMADLIQQKDVWPYIRRFLHLRSTFLYYDFDNIITAAAADDKPILLDLANRLFDSFEKLDFAVKKKDKPMTDLYYEETAPLLQELFTVSILLSLQLIKPVRYFGTIYTFLYNSIPRMEKSITCSYYRKLPPKMYTGTIYPSVRNETIQVEKVRETGSSKVSMEGGVCRYCMTRYSITEHMRTIRCYGCGHIIMLELKQEAQIMNSNRPHFWANYFNIKTVSTPKAKNY